MTLQQVEQTEWRDSSLGCPKPDVSYMQVITPGYQVVLFANDLTYTYHTDQSSTVVRCITPGQP